HLGELFDGALLDLFIVGFEQFLPDLEEVDARVNFLDELRGILGQRFFAGRVRFSSATLIGLFRIFAWDARPLLGTLKSSRRAPLLQIRSLAFTRQRCARVAVRACPGLSRGHRNGSSVSVVRTSIERKRLGGLLRMRRESVAMSVCAGSSAGFGVCTYKP